jgi:hypothetical protein
MTATTNRINSIADTAMLVRVNIRMFNAVKTDRKVSNEVAANHGAQANMTRFSKALVAKEALEAIRKLAGEIRQEHYRRTLPWSDDGSRILTSAGYFAYAEFMRDCESKWQPAIDDLLDNWSSLVDEAQAKLGSLFNINEYPTPTKLRDSFEFRWGVRPVPVADDFRVSLGATEVAAIRSEIQRDLNDTVQQAMKDVWTRMQDVVSKMRAKLDDYDPNNPSAHPFRDTLVTNITDLLDVLPSLNLTGNPDVESFTRRIRQDLTRFTAQQLRDNLFSRQDTAMRADQILSQMSQFVA